jgi:hypothetical protein
MPVEDEGQLCPNKARDGGINGIERRRAYLEENVELQG